MKKRVYVEAKDPIVQEVRKYRMQHTEKFGGDLAAICAGLRGIQETLGHKVVRLAPKKYSRTTTRDRTPNSPKRSV